MSPFHREFQNLVFFVFGIKIPKYIKIHHAENSERIAVCKNKKKYPYIISKCIYRVWRTLKFLVCWYWHDFRSLTTFHYIVWTEVQLSSCTPWEFLMNISASKPASVVSILDSLLVLGTGHGRARTCKFWWPSRFHQTAREGKQAALVGHWNWIIFTNFFSCSAFQTCLFIPLFLPAQKAVSRWWSYKEKSTKVQWDQIRF